MKIEWRWITANLYIICFTSLSHILSEECLAQALLEHRNYTRKKLCNQPNEQLRSRHSRRPTTNLIFTLYYVCSLFSLTSSHTPQTIKTVCPCVPEQPSPPLPVYIDKYAVRFFSGQTGFPESNYKYLKKVVITAYLSSFTRFGLITMEKSTTTSSFTRSRFITPKQIPRMRVWYTLYKNADIKI